MFVSFDCKSIYTKQIRPEATGYCKIKNGYIDTSLPDSVALVHGTMLAVKKIDFGTLNCGGQIFINYKRLESLEPPEFSIKL